MAKINPKNFSANRHEIEVTRTNRTARSNGWTVRTGTVGGKLRVVSGFQGTTLGEVRGLFDDWKKGGIDQDIIVTIRDSTGQKTITGHSSFRSIQKENLLDPKKFRALKEKNLKMNIRFRASDLVQLNKENRSRDVSIAGQKRQIVAVKGGVAPAKVKASFIQERNKRIAELKSDQRTTNRVIKAVEKDLKRMKTDKRNLFGK